MASTEQLHAGSLLLNRYVLAEHLGLGLGGETWRAVPVAGGPSVAVKVMRANADWRAHRDLLNEAAFLRELDHPNVVRYLGIVDLPDGATFLITEFVEGGNLWTWARQNGPCSPGDTAALVLQIAQGLTAVHERGILHRDLKPQNVLVRPSAGTLPRLLVADFGISRRGTVGTAAITHVAGTPGYAAPEAWGGSTVTGAVDVYGLGAIAWFLLTAHDPEPAVGSTQLDPRDLRRMFGPETLSERHALLALVTRMLALAPGARPLLPEVCLALGAAAGGSSPEAGPRTRPHGPPRTVPTPAGHDAGPPDGTTLVPEGPFGASPTGLLAGAAGLGALLVFLCAGGAWWWNRSPGWGQPPETVPTELPVSAEPPLPAPLAGPRQSPDAAVAGVGTASPAAPTPGIRAPAGQAAGVSAPAPTPVPATDARTDAHPASIASTPPGRVGRLRVGIDAPNGLPADVTLSVTDPGGSRKESRSTQVVSVETTSGPTTVEVRSATRILAQEVIDVPAGDDVRVLCKAPASDFSGMRCAVLP